MRILSLHIENIRGIRELTLNPGGENMVIWGLNGSGKSAVVDALDFLLTERMTRLTGSGTRGITLKSHGPHIDCDDATKAIVSAKIKLPNSSSVFQITRCLDKPTELDCGPIPVPELMESALNLAKRGQHVLTRREILKFVTAEGKQRSEQIQLLLNITEIESVRQSLVKVTNNFKRQLSAEKAKFDVAKQDIQNTTLVDKLTPGAILDFINNRREILRAAPLEKLEYADLKRDVQRVSVLEKYEGINTTIALQDISNLKGAVQGLKERDALDAENLVFSLLREINSEPSTKLAIKRKQLIDLGTSLIDEDGDCPLCDTDWAPGELGVYLNAKRAMIELAESKTKEIDSKVGNIVELNKSARTAFGRVLEIASRLSLIDESSFLKNCLTSIDELSTRVVEITDNYVWDESSSIRVSSCLNDRELVDILSRIESELVKKVPVATPEQTAWDLLTRLEENLRVYDRDKHLYEVVIKRKALADDLLKHFEDSRDDVLSELYEQIKAKFIDLYKQLHGEDEKEFAASFEPDGAALKFEVDFYGRGHHPPHALHSEGHQDSMGVCLYLALADQLSKDILDLVVLDDVVMSVDIEHRKQLCKVLNENFPHRQFIITTHDQTWAEMLKKEGVVTSRGLKEFFNWTVDTGPNVNDHEDLWLKIENDLSRNDLSAAAARLRKGSEHRFYEICDALKAQIRFKAGGQWDFGDLSQAGVAGIKKLIKDAKASANSWNDVHRMAEITSFDADLTEAVGDFESEKWSVNPLVHYNDWITLAPVEFRSVVAAYRRLFEVLACRQNPDCGSIFYVTTVGMVPDSFRCKCGALNWTLNRK